MSSTRFVLVLSLLALSCGGPAVVAPPPEPAEPEPAAPPPAPPPVCHFEIPAPRDVSVVPPEGSGEFAVRVEIGEIGAEPGEDWDDVDVEVRAALLFEGTASVEELRAIHDAPLESPLASLTAGARVRGLRHGPNGPEVAVAFGDASEPLTFELRPLPLDCAALVLDAEPVLNDRLALDVEGAALRVAREEAVVLAPTASASSGLRVERLSGVLPFWVVEEAGPRSRVVWRWDDGSEIGGWVDSASLREPRGDERRRIECALGRCGDRVGEAYGLGGLGTSGVGSGGGNVYQGPATVRRGAPVFVGEAYRGEWARVAQEAQFTVRWVRGSEWVRLTAIPGLRIRGLGRAWVERSKVTIPGEE